MVDRAKQNRTIPPSRCPQLPNPHKAIASGELLDRLNEMETWIRDKGEALAGLVGVKGEAARRSGCGVLPWRKTQVAGRCVARNRHKQRLGGSVCSKINRHGHVRACDYPGGHH